MRLPLRPILITAALVAIGGFAAALGGCASKRPQPDSSVATATPAAKPQAKPRGKGASDGAEPSAPQAANVSDGTATSAGGGASLGVPAPTVSASAGGAGTAVGGASAGAGVPTGGGASGGTRTSAGGGASGDSPGGAASPSDRAQTPDERRAALDRRLNDSLGSFDERLRKEQQRIAQERDARQATVTTVAAANGSPKSDPTADQNAEAAGSTPTDLPQKSSASQRGTTESRSARGGDLKSDKTAGGGGSASGNGAMSNEIPAGNDDDVIARRLRRAAEQETDPELKDKLWKEYVEYKKNTQGK
jgi:hypothetical protein